MNEFVKVSTLFSIYFSIVFFLLQKCFHLKWIIHSIGY